MRHFSAILLAATMLTASAHAAPAATRGAADEALDLAKKAIALRSVRDPGNQTPKVAALYKAALMAGGFAQRDVEVVPVDDTAYLIATWPGRDPWLKPLVISAIWTSSRPSRRTGGATRSRRWSRMAISTGAARPT